VPSTPPSTSGSKTSSRAVALGPTLAIGLGSGDFLVVLVLALAILFGLGVPVTYFIGRRRGRW
jgi:hypothetical protein